SPNPKHSPPGRLAALAGDAELCPPLTKEPTMRNHQDIFVQRAVELLLHNDVHLDANETSMLERELTQLRTTTYTEGVAPSLARTFLPQATDIAQSAERYAYKVYKLTGSAKVGGNDTDDAPLVDVAAHEVTGKVYPVRDAFKYALNEI